jgi:hypothetical protein
MSNELATRTAGVQISTMDELARVADMFAKSGLFRDTADAAQAGVKIMAGQAWGIDAFSSMVGIALIQGKPVIGAGIMAAKVKGHPKYDFIVNRLDNEACEIEFFQYFQGENRSIGVSTFTLEDAKQAGYASKQNYRQTPRNMLFARALSNGVRWYTPDVFSSSVYTPEEFNQDGDAVDVPVREAPARPERPAAPALNAPAQEPTPEPAAAPEASGEPVEAAPVDGGGVTVKQLSALAIAVKKQGLTPEQSRAFLSWVLDRPISSAKDLTKAEASRVIGWDDSQFSEALSDYAVALDGGPPEDGPDLSDLASHEDAQLPAFDPSGKADRKARKAVGA